MGDMKGSRSFRHSPLNVWALPILLLLVCAAAVLTVHLAGNPEKNVLSGLTFEAETATSGKTGSDERQLALSTRLVVTSVKDGGPAEAVGIRTGDVIERIEGMDIHTIGDVDRAVAPHRAGPLHVQVGRPGLALEVELPSRKDQVK